MSVLPAHSQERSLEEDARNTQRWLAASADAILKCSEHGASTCFVADPTRMSEALSINNATFKKVLIERGCPDVDQTQHILLTQFQQEWQRDVEPLLAQRIVAYGKEKLAAEGYTCLVREWLEANHTAHVDMTAQHANSDDINGDYGNFLYNFGYGNFLEVICRLNKNKDCKKWLDTLSNQDSSTASTLTALEKAADLYEANSRFFVKDHNIDSMKDAVLDAIRGLQTESSLQLAKFSASISAPETLKFLPSAEEIHHLHAALQDLRHGLYALVETPFYSHLQTQQRNGAGNLGQA